MVISNQLSPGMIISLKKELYRIESAVKVMVENGEPFIKTCLKNLNSDKIIDKNFKLNQPVKEVDIVEKQLEFLYPEDTGYAFLDTETLDIILVPSKIVAENINYLKAGIKLKATICEDKIFSVELPQFLELMVVSTETLDGDIVVSNATKVAVLETGAKIDVPVFVEEGDVVKVDTVTEEYIQRI